MPPEWFDTTSAPPSGKASKPRTSDRNHPLMIGPTAFFTFSVNFGSHLAISGLSMSFAFIGSLS